MRSAKEKYNLGVFAYSLDFVQFAESHVVYNLILYPIAKIGGAIHVTLRRHTKGMKIVHLKAIFKRAIHVTLRRHTKGMKIVHLKAIFKRVCKNLQLARETKAHRK